MLLERDLKSREPLLWVNPRRSPEWVPDDALNPVEAEERFKRNAGVLQQTFPMLQAAGGTLSSPLVKIPKAQARLCATTNTKNTGTWWLKRDDSLPIAGSVKARGAFHEILHFAETLQRQYEEANGVKAALSSPTMRALFSEYTVAVGSTGNLGMGVGLIAAGLGFRAVVHMSREAASWKKDKLRARGIEVVEHAGDYAAAVAAGREVAMRDEHIHFVDDEKSHELFLGYSAAGREVADQLNELGLQVDDEHPLFVYIPCGVGGAPGGIAYGLRRIFGKNLHCFFAEPVESPAMLVQMASGSAEPVDIYEFGLSNRTLADGLAVPQASMLVAPLMQSLLSGIFLVQDETLYQDLLCLVEDEQIRVEPSAVAALRGPTWLGSSDAGRAYIEKHGLADKMAQANHVIWSTGGALLPPEIFNNYIEQARSAVLQNVHVDLD